MTKVLEPNRTGNGGGAGKRKQHGDPFADLRRRIRDWAVARGSEDRRAARRELSGFVESLSTEHRRRICLTWLKANRKVQERLHRALVDALGGTGGPAAVLLGELWGAMESRAERLPDRLLDGLQRLAEEGPTLPMVGGVPEPQTKAVAMDLARDPNEAMRAFYIEQGATPNAVDALLAQARRNRKWTAATNAIAPEILAAGDRDKERDLRPRVEKATRLAARFTAAAAELATCVQGIALDRRQISRYYTAGPDSVPWWFPFGEELSGVAKRSEKLARELREFTKELVQPAGAPTNRVVRSAARKLEALGLEHRQIADILVTVGIARDGYTHEHVRDALRERTETKAARGLGNTGRRPR
jgi:hypothetical protein